MRKKDFKLYADECIEKHLVDHLREEHNFNVKSVIEDGLRGRPDHVILKRANELRRFLLTYNDKHFFSNDKLCPFNGLFGIICLNFHKTDYPCHHLFWLSKHDKQSLRGKKYLLSYDDISIRYKGEDGKVVKEILHAEDCLLCTLDEEKESK